MSLIEWFGLTNMSPCVMSVETQKTNTQTVMIRVR